MDPVSDRGDHPPFPGSGELRPLPFTSALSPLPFRSSALFSRLPLPSFPLPLLGSSFDPNLTGSPELQGGTQCAFHTGHELRLLYNRGILHPLPLDVCWP